MGGSGDIHVAGTGSFALEVAEWARDAGMQVAGLVELQDPGVGVVVGLGDELVGLLEEQPEESRADQLEEGEPAPPERQPRGEHEESGGPGLEQQVDGVHAPG